jgi:hypothetical protein
MDSVSDENMAYVDKFYFRLIHLPQRIKKRIPESFWNNLNDWFLYKTPGSFIELFSSIQQLDLLPQPEPLSEIINQFYDSPLGKSYGLLQKAGLIKNPHNLQLILSCINPEFCCEKLSLLKQMGELTPLKFSVLSFKHFLNKIPPEVTESKEPIAAHTPKDSLSTYSEFTLFSHGQLKEFPVRHTKYQLLFKS